MIFLLVGFLSFANEKSLVDFRSSKCPSHCYSLTDQVRGGQSTLNFEKTNQGLARLFGKLSLIQGAGFASYRIKADLGRSWNFSKGSKIVISGQGDGRTYKFLVKDAQAINSPRDYSWQVAFQPASLLGDKVVLLKDLKAVVRGREVSDVAPLDLTNIREIGIQINDKVPGNFELFLKSIKLQ